MDNLPIWHILLVDDDEDDYYLTHEMLREAQGRKVELEWAATFEAGQSALMAKLFDAVLVDYDLGARSGIELIRTVDHRQYPAPFILYTGRGSYEVDLEAMAAGFTLYVTKTEANPLLLERVIRYAIERKQAETALIQTQSELELANARLNGVLQTQPVGTWIADPSRKIIEKNHMADKIWHGEAPLSPDVRSYSVYDGWWNATGEPLAPEEWGLAKALKGETVLEQVIDILRFDGSRGTILNAAAPLYSNEQQLLGAVAISQDITAMKRAEAEREALMLALQHEKSQVEHLAAYVRERADELESLFAAVSDIILLLDTNGQVVRSNPAAHKVFGFNPTSLQQQDACSRINLRLPNNRPYFLPDHTHREPSSKQATTRKRVLMTNAAGKDRTCIVSTNPVFNQASNLVGMVAVFHDITDLQQALLKQAHLIDENRRQRREVEAEQARLQAMMDSALVAILFVDTSGRITWRNRQADAIFGSRLPIGFDYTSGETPICYPHGSPFNTEDLPLNRSLREGISFHNVELLIKDSQGKDRHILAYTAPVLDQAGMLLGAVGVFRDISELKKAEKALSTSNERFRLASKAVDGILYDWDLQTGEFFSSGGLKHDVGFNPNDEQVHRSEWLKFVHSEDLPNLEHLEQEIRSGDQDFCEVEYRIKHPDGHWVDLWDRATILRNFAGEPVRVVGSAADISRRKNIERDLVTVNQTLEEQKSELAQKNQQLQGLFDHAPAGVALFDAEYPYRVLAHNRIYQDFFPESFRSNGMLGLPLTDFVNRAEEEGILEIFRTVAQTGEGQIIFNFAYDGMERGRTWWNWNLEPIISGGQVTAFAQMAIDITEEVRARHRLEAELAERERTEQALRESERRFRGTFENAAVGIAHLSLDGTWLEVNQRFCDFLGYTPRELLKLTNQAISAPEDLPAEMERFEMLTSGQIMLYQLEKRYLTKDGRQIWAYITTALQRDEQGDPLYCIAIIQDINDRKKVEEAIHEYAGRLARSNKDLEDFAFLASHDLQEPLRKIETFGSQLRSRLKEKISEDERDYLNRMESASKRMRQMIEALLSLSRVTTRGQPYCEVDLNQVVQDVVEDLEYRIESSHGRVEAGELPLIQADPLQMHQLFQNLVANALKYHRAEVPPHIQIIARLKQNGVAHIEVIDNGIGFDTKHLDRIFQPFQRLHGRSEYEGSGIGLALCRKIVDRHGGQITANSIPGTGSTFVISLPVNH